jgi:hypothetical protein
MTISRAIAEAKGKMARLRHMLSGRGTYVYEESGHQAELGHRDQLPMAPGGGAALASLAARPSYLA